MEAVRPGPAPAAIFRRFTRGRERPRGVVWFGAGSFWGHLRHLVTSAIASENIDSRDWMTADEPTELRARIAEVLGGDAAAPSLVEGLGRELYLDFVADTGDDISVSRAVARLIFSSYELPDPDRSGAFLEAPRGEILIFGGDTAYPVATAREITNRVLVPWNQVLAGLPDDGRPRVLLGVAGNHDWYDGLDGFQRMFRWRPWGQPVDAGPLRPRPDPHALWAHAAWVPELLRGGTLDKPPALVLTGYTPVQNATYLALTLAPQVELMVVDRQLREPDSRQASFLRAHHQARPESALLLMLPDPVYPFGEPSPTGKAMIESLRLDLGAHDTFVLTGDIHHYERLEQGPLLQVIAGGGGAFLHPARLAPGGLQRVAVWPGVEQSRRLLRQVPGKLALGRSGFLPHIALFLLFTPAVILGARFYEREAWLAPLVLLMTVVLGATYALIGGVLRRRAVLLPAVVAALVTSFIPVVGAGVVRLILGRLSRDGPQALVVAGTLLVTVFAGTFVFGAYLAVLTLLGHENLQAFTVLDHPGFKHFVRLRVRADGSGIDGWCIGVTDPLGPQSRPVLVDRFTWRPVRGAALGPRLGE
jgi:hypothetical protein